MSIDNPFKKRFLAAGLLFDTGQKRDSWFAIDPKTGAKIQTLSVDGIQQVCPSKETNNILIGRTGEC